MDDKLSGEKRQRILIIDDDEAHLKTLADILELEELLPICCSTGKQALEAIKNSALNVAILDLRLPDINGLELLKQLKKHNPDIKVIVNTGYASLESAMTALNEEAFAYVKKMGDIEELLSHVHRAFHSHLAIYSDKLEQEVNKRTAELAQTNKNLKVDIARRRLAEEALKESEERFRRLAEASFEGIVISDNSKILDINERFAEMFGYKVDENIGMDILNLVAPESQDLVLHRISSGYEEPYEYLAVHKDGTIFAVETHAKSIPYEGRKIRVTSVRNISERKKSQESLIKHEKDLKKLTTQLVKTQEAERRRLSLELHDEMGQALTAIKIDLSTIEKDLPSEVEQSITERLAETNHLVDGLIDQIHEISLDLRPKMLDDLGLKPTLNWYSNRFAKRQNIPVRFEAGDLKKRLAPEYETVLYRVTQETLTNIAKYARADNVKIDLKETNNFIRLTIEDDGIGFDLDEVTGREPDKRGSGLIGIQERGATLNGKLEIQSAPDKGTRITLQFPVEEKI